MGYLPVAGSGVEFLGSLGAGLVKAKRSWSGNFHDTPNLFYTVTGLIRNNSESTEGKWSFVPRIGAGVKWDIDKTFGVRAIVRWEMNSNLRLKGDDKGTFKPFDNGLSLNLGVYAKF